MVAGGGRGLSRAMTGIRGVEAGRGAGPRPLIRIHIDKGGNRKATKYFFDKLNSYGVGYDVTGQSYYPWWQGTLLELRKFACATSAAVLYCGST